MSGDRTSERGRQREAQVRAAMERLLTNRAIHGGALDVKGLALEAGVHRQELYRSHAHLVDEFREHVTRLQTDGQSPDPRSQRIERLSAELQAAEQTAQRLRRERDEARREREAYASQIAFLAEQNQNLRERAAHAEGTVSMRRRSAQRGAAPGAVPSEIGLFDEPG